jgi:hypothetical protein
VPGGGYEATIVVGEENSNIRLAQAHRLFEHRIEHWREIARRGVDDLQHIGGRGLLCARFGEFGGAFGEAGFERGNSPAKIGGLIFVEGRCLLPGLLRHLATGGNLPDYRPPGATATNPGGR